MRLLCKPLHYLAGYFYYYLKLKIKKILKQILINLFPSNPKGLSFFNKKKQFNTIFETRIRTKRLELLRNHFHSCLRGDCLPNFNMFALLILYKLIFLFIFFYSI